MGFRGIFISNDPLETRRYDNPMWEKFWTAVEEYDMPVNVHILTRQGGPQVGANPLVDGVLLPIPAFRTIAEMITGGVFEKHPDLKMISVENDIGWIPNFLKRMEWYGYRFAPRYPHMKRERGRLSGSATSTPPSRTTSRACAAATSSASTSSCGASDYPHFDSTFPKSRDAIERNFEGVPDDETRADPRRQHGARLRPAGHRRAHRREVTDLRSSDNKEPGS